MFRLGGKTSAVFWKHFAKWQIKALLAFFAFAIVLTVIIFTQSLVDDLIKREQKILQFYAKIYKYHVDSWSMESASEQQFDDFESSLFFLDEIIPTITFPFIMTDSEDMPLEPFETWSLNVYIDTSLSLDKQREYMRNYVSKMANSYPPIVIEDSEGRLLAKFYYNHSAIIDGLRFFPVISILIIGAFIFVGYLAFSSVRKTEESKVWVGMAREAAHQLGTPLSSLLAWIEIIKYNCADPKYVNETLAEMENDLSRLNTIATRFSKIGSMPELQNIEISEKIENVCRYFERRLPHLGKKVDIVRDLNVKANIRINSDLFDWVIENLLKNAAEAIDEKTGEVHLSMKVNPGKKVYIYVRDTGKGMSSQVKRQVFNPGFTTKKRGWGLGLSLVKRIIEEYHRGRIYIKDSIIGKGTTFVIELPMNEEAV